VARRYQLTDGRHGRFLVNPNDGYVGRSLIAYGEWGEAEVRLFDRLLRPGDWVVEVGANLGSHTVPMSRRVGPAGRVHAYEPQRLVHQLLCANLALNDCFNVHTHRQAVGAAPGVGQICDIEPSKEVNYGGIAVNIDYGSLGEMTEIPIVSLDSLTLDRLDFVKIDAEGMDVAVLSGAAETIRHHRPLVFLEATPAGLETIVATLSDMDYDCYWYVSRLFDPDNFRQAQEDLWADLGYILVSADIIAAPRAGSVCIEGLPPAAGGVDWTSLFLSPDNHRTGLTIHRAD
jgi:FkbM family methyltransferase